jgi:hypothetical protein
MRRIKMAKDAGAKGIIIITSSFILGTITSSTAVTKKADL